jgi:hypothetical protein
MNFLCDALAGVGAVLLPVAAVLLFEELTLGGLVRLLLARQAEARKDEEPRNRKGDRTCWH